MRRHLDTPGSRPYKARPLGVAAVLLAATVASAGEGMVVNGAVLPDGAEKVGENRYRARENFAEVEKFYKKIYPVNAYPRKNVINQPGIKAAHIVNPDGKKFEGLNVYEANEEVRIFIVPAEQKRKRPEGKPAKK